MFTVKIYDFDYHTVELYECEGLRRQILTNGDVEIQIRHRADDSNNWRYIRLRDTSQTSIANRAKWAANADESAVGTGWDFKHEAVVENGAGKTTEVIRPSMAPEKLPATEPSIEPKPPIAMAA